MEKDRYCRNCGHELQTEDRFCANCGRPVHDTAHVPTPEADVPVPPPIPPAQASDPQPQEQPPGEERDATWWAMQLMVVVFLVLGIGETVQGMPATSSKSVGFQVGVGMAPAIVAVLVVAALILLLGGVYYATGRKQGVTFREAVFNWPLVIVAAIVTFLFLL
jgi:hypothetical protein